MESQIFKLPYGNGEFTVEVGKMAQLCNGSAVVRYGDTVILATATMSREARPGVNFLPLSVAYQEKMYASGKIKSSKFIKRETRPSDDKVLMGRVVDRTLRPMFPKYIRNDIQVMCTTLSYDVENEHDMIAAVAASAALSVSDIPFDGPTATVRVGLINGEFVLNPTHEARMKSDLDLIVSSDANNVIMIEAGANEVPEEKMLEAIQFGKKWGQKIVAFLADIQKKVGKKKIVMVEPKEPEAIVSYIEKNYEDKVMKALFEKTGKLERYAYFQSIVKECKEYFKDKATDDEIAQIGDIVDHLVKHTVRKNILENNKRIGGRKMDEIRPLHIEVGVLPRTHGSALFQRGETQCLTTCTLGAPGDAQIVDGIEGEEKKDYFHHYNFPPFSVGETSNRLMPGNREIGHGALAERGVEVMLPKDKVVFPYTIRTVSEILQSNGSSSMAATCGSSLALADAGVPLKKMVGGVAMGLMTSHHNPDLYKVLTDLQDEEDMGGDMDFKVTGTRDGITAIQMDIKIKGLPDKIFKEALEQAYKGRIQILDAMEKVIKGPRPELSKYAPRIITLKVNPEKIRFIIGPGGEMINKITAETGVQIDIEDDGTVMITTANAEMGQKAKEWIEGICADPVVGTIYKGCKVTKMFEFGALVEFMPKREGMVHVSEIADQFVQDINTVIKLGDIVDVKLMEIDEASGKYRLSIKRAKMPSAK